MTTLPPTEAAINNGLVPAATRDQDNGVRGLSASLVQGLSAPMRLVRFKTPLLALEAYDVPPWLVLFTIIATMLMVWSGAWVWI